MLYPAKSALYLLKGNALDLEYLVTAGGAGGEGYLRSAEPEHIGEKLDGGFVSGALDRRRCQLYRKNVVLPADDLISGAPRAYSDLQTHFPHGGSTSHRAAVRLPLLVGQRRRKLLERLPRDMEGPHAADLQISVCRGTDPVFLSGPGGLERDEIRALPLTLGLILPFGGDSGTKSAGPPCKVFLPLSISSLPDPEDQDPENQGVDSKQQAYCHTIHKS